MHWHSACSGTDIVPSPHRVESHAGVVAVVLRDQQTVRLAPAELDAMARHSAEAEEPTDHTRQTAEMVPLVAVIDSIIEAMETVQLVPVPEDGKDTRRMAPLAPVAAPGVETLQARGSAPLRRERATKRSREILRVEDLRRGGSGPGGGGGSRGGSDR